MSAQISTKNFQKPNNPARGSPPPQLPHSCILKITKLKTECRLFPRVSSRRRCQLKTRARSGVLDSWKERNERPTRGVSSEWLSAWRCVGGVAGTAGSWRNGDIRRRELGRLPRFRKLGASRRRSELLGRPASRGRQNWTNPFDSNSKSLEQLYKLRSL